MHRSFVRSAHQRETYINVERANDGNAPYHEPNNNKIHQHRHGEDLAFEVPRLRVDVCDIDMAFGEVWEERVEVFRGGFKGLRRVGF